MNWEPDMTLDESNAKRALVTGGAGFIGSHLVDRLLERGYAVICADDFSTGFEQNLAHQRDNPRLQVIRHDIAEPLNAEVDEIYNLACPASPFHYQRDPIRTTRTSVLGALNVLELAGRLGCRVLQASTSEVYGDPAVFPQAETYWGNVNPVGPRACYDEGKRCAETLFFDHHRQQGTDIRVARIFNTYGPRMHPNDGRVVSNFIVQALRGEALTIYGNGSQTRSFCYVDDMVEGLQRLMATEDTPAGPVNLGNPETFSILELAERVIAATGSRSRLDFRDLPPDDPRQRRPDIARAEALLDWAPQVPLDRGLLPTIAYYREVLGLPAHPA